MINFSWINNLTVCNFSSICKIKCLSLDKEQYSVLEQFFYITTAVPLFEKLISSLVLESWEIFLETSSNGANLVLMAGILFNIIFHWAWNVEFIKRQNCFHSIKEYWWWPSHWHFDVYSSSPLFTYYCANHVGT